MRPDEEEETATPITIRRTMSSTSRDRRYQVGHNKNIMMRSSLLLLLMFYVRNSTCFSSWTSSCRIERSAPTRTTDGSDISRTKTTTTTTRVVRLFHVRHHHQQRRRRQQQSTSTSCYSFPRTALASTTTSAAGGGGGGDSMAQTRNSPSGGGDSSSSSSSPPVLSIEGLSCTHDGGGTWQLKDVSYNLQRGAKVALIGRNGTGKSTLLKILHGSYLDSLPSSGSGGGTSQQQQRQETNYRYTGTVRCPKTVRVSMVDQEPPMPSDVTVGDAILGITTATPRTTTTTTTTPPPSVSRSRNLFDIVRNYRIASQRADVDPSYFATASADMDSIEGGWDVLTRAEEIATKLKIHHLQDQPLSSLSGGERKRVALCAALVEEPDVLLLDEPTNFLSLAGVDWLAELLTSNTKKLTILMVTHDRAFLEEVCDRILELDRGSLFEHNGSYSSYLEAKMARYAAEDAAVRAAKAKYKVELDWMRRQPQARETKSKARIDAFYKLEQSTKPRPRDPNLNLIQTMGGAERRIGGKILSMKNVCLTLDDEEGDADNDNRVKRIMLDDFSYDFCTGDRICLAGANGVGKTTFTKLLTGELAPTSGKVEIGETVVMGNYDQLGLKFDETAESQTVLEYVLDQIYSHDLHSSNDMSSTAGPAVEARKLLKQFEFSRPRWSERVSVLSGGERRRLQLLSVLSKKPNFLVLDEPSVDCDLDTLTALENYLEQYQGVLLVVSHDRAFADKVTDHLFVFEGEGIVKDFQGSLSEYGSCLVEIENRKIQSTMLAANNGAAIDATGSTITKQATYKEDRAKRNEIRNVVRQMKKEMLNIERALEKLKLEAEKVQSDLDAAGTDAGWTVLAELTDKLNSLNEKIDEKELRWLELGEELEGMDVED